MMFMWIIPLVLLYLLLERSDRQQDSRKWVLVGLAVLALPMLGMGFMGGMMGGYGGRYGGMMGGFGYMGRFGGWGWQGAAVGLILFAVIGVVAYLALHKKGESAGSDTEEIRILKLRLARGEISPEEYDRLREKLNG